MSSGDDAPPRGSLATAVTFVRAHWVWTAEIAVTLLLIHAVATDAGFRAVLGTALVAVLGALRSTAAMLVVDPGGTALAVGITLAKVVLATLPVLVLAFRLPPRERIRIPLWSLVLLPTVPLAAASCAVASRWVLLIGLSFTISWAMKLRWLRWTFFVPILVLVEPALNHGFGRAHWTTEELDQHCRANDGHRPLNLVPSQLGHGYHGLNLLRQDELLVDWDEPGEGAFGYDTRGRIPGSSWWLRRGSEGWSFDASSEAIGSTWVGCVMDDVLWSAGAAAVLGVSRDRLTGVETIRRIRLPATEMDFSDVVCRADEGRILAFEALGGSAIWEVRTDDGTFRRLRSDVGGTWIIPRPRPDGRVVASTTSEFVVYDADAEAVVARSPAGAFVVGSDVCPHDGHLAAADFTGRVRFFSPTDDGRYTFSWGVSVHAPRYVAFSPDCSHVAVTSGNDRRVYLINRAEQRLEATYRVGPALRSVAFLGPREFGVADACSLTTFTF